MGKWMKKYSKNHYWLRQFLPHNDLFQYLTIEKIGKKKPSRAVENYLGKS